MGGGHIDVLIGLLSGAAASAAAVIFAFARHAWRFFVEAMRSHSTYADRLCAGIFITACGSALSGLAVLARIITGEILLPLYLLGWTAMAAGYFFMFCAWHGAILGRMWWFRWSWGVLVVIIGIGAAEIFRALPNP